MLFNCYKGFPGGARGKEPTCQRRRGQFDSWVRKIPERRASYSSILAWRIPWTEEPGRLQSIGQRVRQLKWLSTHTCTPVINWPIFWRDLSTKHVGLLLQWTCLFCFSLFLRTYVQQWEDRLWVILNEFHDI